MVLMIVSGVQVREIRGPARAGRHGVLLRR